MTTELASIWDTAKQHGTVRSKSVSQQQRRSKIQSVIRTPIVLMRLVLLLMTIYALTKYIPAFVNLKPMLTQTNAQSGAINQIEGRKKWGVAAPLRDQIKLRKAYVLKGQSIQAQFILPQNANAQITLQQCKRVIFVEAFNCKVVQSKTVDISSKKAGTHRFIVNESAMYIMESRVETQPGEEFDITWRRH